MTVDAHSIVCTSMQGLKQNVVTTSIELASQNYNRQRLGRLSTNCYFTENNEADIHTPIKYHTNITNVNHARSNYTVSEMLVDLTLPMYKYSLSLISTFLACHIILKLIVFYAFQEPSN